MELSAPTTFKLDSAMIHMDKYKKYKITYTSDSPEYVEEKGVTMTSTDDNIVTVESASMELAGLSDGKSTVTVRKRSY